MSDLTWLKNGHHEDCPRYVHYGYDHEGNLRGSVITDQRFVGQPRCTCDEMRLPL